MSRVRSATRLREAQYPARTVSFVDPDGTPFYLTY